LRTKQQLPAGKHQRTRYDHGSMAHAGDQPTRCEGDQDYDQWARGHCQACQTLTKAPHLNQEEEGGQEHHRKADTENECGKCHQCVSPVLEQRQINGCVAPSSRPDKVTDKEGCACRHWYPDCWSTKSKTFDLNDSVGQS
jgi:hypothetical protein